MKMTKNALKSSGRNSHDVNQNKPTTQDYRKALEKATKDTEEYMSQVFELKTILTKHKSKIEQHSKSIAQLTQILAESNTCLKSTLSNFFIFIDFYKEVQSVTEKHH